MKAAKKSWFRRHWILTGILGFFIFLTILGMLSDSDINSDYSDGELISIESHSIVPQDSEVDREWRIMDLVIDSNFTGFLDGSEKQMSKSETFGGSVVVARVYRFSSINNSNKFYEQEKTKIDIRGVEEWSLGIGCFGIERDNTLSGYAEGFCVRNNVVLYVESTSSSCSYTGDGKKFMNMMLKRV